VELPADLTAVLEAHGGAHWNDETALVALYAKDSFVTTNIDQGKRGAPELVAKYASTRFRAAYRMQPTAFVRNGNAASVAGVFLRGEPSQTIGFFHLTLVKEEGWKIVGAQWSFPGPPVSEPESAKDLIAALDDAGIRKAVVLSDAYFFDSPVLTPQGGSYDAVRAENDWTAEQTAQYPDRLVAFCSLNPLSDYALQELRRCAESGRFKGLKLHLGVSRIDLLNAEHVARLRTVVGEANELKMPLVVHVRNGSDYGARHAHILLDQIVSAAPSVSFTIAHLWGGEAYSAEALGVYANALSAHDPHAKNLYFDIAELDLVIGEQPDALEECAKDMRQIGLDRILYGTDGPISESQTPRDGWARTQAALPLTEAEFVQIANNVAPYLR
jgi:predicted TIM-barrel fold metal-dependent hydrolase